MVVHADWPQHCNLAKGPRASCQTLRVVFWSYHQHRSCWQLAVGWFLHNDPGQHCKLTRLQWIHDAPFDGWKQGIGLFSSLIWLQMCSMYGETGFASVPINSPSSGAMFFCVTMQSVEGIVSVKLLPVVSANLFHCSRFTPSLCGGVYSSCCLLHEAELAVSELSSFLAFVLHTL